MNERAWLVLGHAHVRVAELRSLLDFFGSVADVVAQPRARLAETGLSEEKCDAIVSPDDDAVSAALRWPEVTIGFEPKWRSTWAKITRSSGGKQSTSTDSRCSRRPSGDRRAKPAADATCTPCRR